MKKWFIVLCAALALAFPASASAGVLKNLFGCTGHSCTIAGNMGGDVDTFTEAAHEALRKGVSVQIDGACYSACALFADLARPNVCVTRHAEFGFHQETVIYSYRGEAFITFEPGTYGDSDPPHSPDILAWVYAKGGFPAQGLLMMRSAQAARFWPRCN